MLTPTSTLFAPARTLAGLLLLALGSGAAQAQTAPAAAPAPASRWYAGVQAGLEGRPYVMDRETNQGQTKYAGFMPAATVYGGYQTTAKTALQLGITHGSGTLDEGHELTMWNVPLQFRKLISEPERRLQAGAFAEASVCFVTRKDGLASNSGYHYPTLQATNYFLAVGFSTSYAFSNHLGLNVDLPIIFNPQIHTYLGMGLGISPMAGLRYRF